MVKLTCFDELVCSMSTVLSTPEFHLNSDDDVLTYNIAISSYRDPTQTLVLKVGIYHKFMIKRDVGPEI